MPGLDRTGPLGEGPRTGRALGKCGNAKGIRRSDVGPGAGKRLGGRRPLGERAGMGGGRGRRGGRGGNRM
jgi:hypothetical protein